jgi:hypothetical protein
MRFPFYVISVMLCSCSSKPTQSAGNTETITQTNMPDTTRQENEADEIDFRKEFISLYKQPVYIDTSFVEDGKNYKIIFHHFCTMDNALVVPAKYNFDTNKDFTTHNFASDLIFLSDKDTLFKKNIEKTTFNCILDTLDTPLKKYATLLYPTLNFKNDSIQINYSISIPVTDVGIAVDIKFDKKGNYTISQ